MGTFDRTTAPSPYYLVNSRNSRKAAKSSSAQTRQAVSHTQQL